MLFDLSNEIDRQVFKEKVEHLLKEKKHVEIKIKSTVRTLSQNSYLHVLLSYFASEFGYSLEEVKVEIFKKICNKEIFVRERINKRGFSVCYLRSSKDLDKLEMMQAIERFRNYSSMQCGLYLPEANEGESLFYAMQQIEKFKEYL